MQLTWHHSRTKHEWTFTLPSGCVVIVYGDTQFPGKWLARLDGWNHASHGLQATELGKAQREALRWAAMQGAVLANEATAAVIDCGTGMNDG